MCKESYNLITAESVILKTWKWKTEQAGMEKQMQPWFKLYS